MELLYHDKTKDYEVFVEKTRIDSKKITLTIKDFFDWLNVSEWRIYEFSASKEAELVSYLRKRKRNKHAPYTFANPLKGDLLRMFSIDHEKVENELANAIEYKEWKETSLNN